MMSLPASAAALLRPVLDYVLPPRCPACGVIVPDDGRFCLDCWTGMEFLGDPCCARCGVPFDMDQGADALCAPCLHAPAPVDRARAVLAYGEAARSVALKLKYGRRIGMARLIAGHMVRHVPATGREAMIVAPVPLHRWRTWNRGFNQSALIARHLARALAMPVAMEALVRVRRTPPLKGMGPVARARTVRGAFRPGRDVEQIRGRTVILIDDVMTSGATANACAAMLKKSGAAQVHLLCWAQIGRAHV